MPFRFEYETEKKILLIMVEGKVRLDDLEQLYDNIVTSTLFPPDIRSIWDFRQADFTTIDTRFLKKIIALRKKYPQRGTARAAFVVDSDLGYGVSRMYETLSAFELPQHIRAFRDYAEAQTWLLTEK